MICISEKTINVSAIIATRVRLLIKSDILRNDVMMLCIMWDVIKEDVRNEVDVIECNQDNAKVAHVESCTTTMIRCLTCRVMYADKNLIDLTHHPGVECPP